MLFARADALKISLKTNKICKNGTRMTRVRQMKTDFYSAKQNKPVNIPYSIHSFYNFVLENKKISENPRLNDLVGQAFNMCHPCVYSLSFNASALRCLTPNFEVHSK